MPTGRPRAYPVKKIIGFDEKMVEAVDKWRSQQPGLPNFSEAIRRLVDLGLGKGSAPEPIAKAKPISDSKPSIGLKRPGQARSFSKADQTGKSPKGSR